MKTPPTSGWSRLTTTTTSRSEQHVPVPGALAGAEPECNIWPEGEGEELSGALTVHGWSVVVAHCELPAPAQA